MSPQDLSAFELARYGLGVVVRDLRTRAAPEAQLQRVYCLHCGMAVDSESRASEGALWWVCLRDCNAPNPSARTI